jgi:hypothetical protein
MARELIWPPALRITNIERRLIGNAGVSRSPLSGATTTVDRSGDRWAISVTVENMSDRASYAERASAEAFIAAIRNRNARVWIHDPSYAQRGSFSAPELFANADFANGTTGWTAQQSVLSASDRVMRVTAARSSTAAPGFTQNPTVTAFRPLVVRSFMGARSRPGATIGIFNALAGGASNYLLNRYGLQSVSLVPITTAAGATYPVVYDGAGGVVMTGDWIECPFTSMSYCALVDNGPNALTYSDQIDNAAWSKTNTTVTADFFSSPALAATADRLVETTANSTHIVQQLTTKAASAQDWCCFGRFRAGTNTDARSRILLRVGDVNGTDYAQGYFDLSTGVADTPSAGGTAASPRSFISPAGNDWYYCAILCTTSTGTTVGGRVYMVQSGTTTSYAGLTTADIGISGFGIARSSVPTRGALTTATALETGTVQTGSGLYLKGLPASTSGLLLAGDAVQIGKQLFVITSRLDSDAAGLGYLEVSPNIRTPFADNDPVIINQPMGRYMLASDDAGYSTRAGRISTMTLDFEEALD